jgi:hypothetical protein
MKKIEVEKIYSSYALFWLKCSKRVVDIVIEFDNIGYRSRIFLLESNFYATTTIGTRNKCLLWRGAH